MEEHYITITLSDVLAFGTGAICEPPMGFKPPPSVDFNNGSYPSANTCSITIFLPTAVTNYQEFVYFVAFGIANSAGFGQL